MSVAFAIVLLVSFAIPLVLWLAISRETSNPTVVDRAEAERIAKEHGGRNPSRSATGLIRPVAGDERTETEWDDRDGTDEQDDRVTGIERDEHDEWDNRHT
ncbi:hypothetical protein HYG81_08875 [Natrinema zhouii]|uniref:Uncharacterized protein n=1 Tax=Natrinema zhouii TaxID=1710539 RepID=A0A7D6CQX6_9EURY|nr:hypothetical protein [Natrinema zhouii]QLK27698.1 hypothetical protein HYG81_08875 [Natrinema zhouii]